MTAEIALVLVAGLGLLTFLFLSISYRLFQRVETLERRLRNIHAVSSTHVCPNDVPHTHFIRITAHDPGENA